MPKKNKRYAFKYHVLPMIAPAWETGSSYYIQIDQAFGSYAEVEGYTPLERRPNKSNLSRSDLNILKKRSVVVNGVKVGLKPMAGACHPHTSYFIPCTYGTSHKTKDASIAKVNQIYQDYLNGLQDIPPHLQLTKGCELAFSGIGRHFNTEITIDAIDFLRNQTVNRDFLEFLNEKEQSMLIIVHVQIALQLAVHRNHRNSCNGIRRLQNNISNGIQFFVCPWVTSCPHESSLGIHTPSLAVSLPVRLLHS